MKFDRWFVPTLFPFRARRWRKLRGWELRARQPWRWAIRDTAIASAERTGRSLRFLRPVV